MAENQDERSSEDLSDEPSPYRVEDYRNKGKVSQSKEVSGLLALLAAGVTTYVMAPSMGQSLLDFMREVLKVDLSARLDFGSTHVLGEIFTKAVKLAISLAAPACLAAFVLGIVGSIVQIGAIFSWEPLTPDVSKIDPIKGFKRWFSMQHVLDGIRLTFKITILALVAYFLVKSEVMTSAKYVLSDVSTLLVAFGESGRWIFLSLVGVLAVFAGFDYGLQKWSFGKNLRTTKQEAKQEHKEREGDPQIRARIRAVQREMARRRMIQAVKSADVIITNPTHIAIALTYDKEKMAAPKVVAKGADFLAQKIKAVASEAGVPLVENVPLARTLYKSVKVGQYIPKNLYQAVAEVLAYVFRIKNRRV